MHTTYLLIGVWNANVPPRRIDALPLQGPQYTWRTAYMHTFLTVTIPNKKRRSGNDLVSPRSFKRKDRKATFDPSPRTVG